MFQNLMDLFNSDLESWWLKLFFWCIRNISVWSFPGCCFFAVHDLFEERPWLSNTLHYLMFQGICLTSVMFLLNIYVDCESVVFKWEYISDVKSSFLFIQWNSFHNCCDTSLVLNGRVLRSKETITCLLIASMFEKILMERAIVLWEASFVIFFVQKQASKMMFNE